MTGIVLVIYHCITINSKTSCLKTFIISQFLSVRNPGAAYLGASASRCLMRLLETTVSKLIHVVVGRIQFLVRCWIKNISFSLAVVQRPFDKAAHNIAIVFSQSGQQNKREHWR